MFVFFYLVMLGSSINPYFLYFDLTLPYNSDIKLFKDNTILLHYAKNEEYREIKKQTKFGKLVSNTSYENYAINNKFLSDNKNFIEKKKSSSKFSFAFIYQNEFFGVWTDYKLDKIYVSYDYLENSPYLFSTEFDNHNENTMFLKSSRKYKCWKIFIDYFQNGKVRFENMKIKNICQNLIKQLLC